VEHRATGQFDLTKDTEPPYDNAPGAAIARAVITKQFHGDLTGTSITHMTQAMTDHDGSAGYVAMERVNGTLDGRTGTFVLQHHALGDRGQRTLSITVLPDSATDQLTGLRGQLDVDISNGRHDYILDYYFTSDASDASDNS